jgi:hypothetical protein
MTSEWAAIGAIKLIKLADSLSLPPTGLLARFERFPFDKTYPQIRPPFG